MSRPCCSGSRDGERLSLNPNQFDAWATALARVATTRRRATALLGGAPVAMASAVSESEAKAKKKRRRKRRKRKSQGSALDKPAHVALGVYMPRVLDDPQVMNGLNNAMGRSPDYVVWYETWSHGNFGQGHRQYLRVIEERGLTPVISWDPYDPSGDPVNQPDFRLSRITDGHWNGYIDSWIEGLKTYGKPVFINFAHEMNGNWFPWGVGTNGNSADGSDFRNAWRYIHDRFRQRGADNVRWVWMPNKVYDTIPASLEQVYPGDGYVDWFGMNGYNWGTSVYWASCPCQSKWESFDKVFGDTYRQLSAIGNKPIMIGETASSDKKGKKASKGKKRGKKKAKWIRQAMLSSVPDRYPNIRAFTWFNAKATGLDVKKNGKVVKTAKVDWRFTSSKKSRKAFAGAARNQYYTASLRDM